MATIEGGRPRPWLLIVFGVVVVLFLASRYWPTTPAAPAPGPSNPTARQQGTPGSGDARIDPAQLDVRLEALTADRGQEGEGDRNPFAFRPKPAPLPPPAPAPIVRAPQPEGPPPPPPGPPPPPRIPLKFIGIVEPTPGEKVAAFSDCRSTTHGREGAIIFGQYRLVRIGVESVVMEYLDGRGRTTIALTGTECVNK
jgi:hypothetical protein